MLTRKNVLLLGAASVAAFVLGKLLLYAGFTAAVLWVLWMLRDKS